jgi:hypothetical protein
VSEATAIVLGGVIYNFLGGLLPTYYFAGAVSLFGALGLLYHENHI